MTFSHLQTIFSAGSVYFPTGPALIGVNEPSGASALKPTFGTMIGALFGLNVGFGTSSKPASANKRTASMAIAGDPARPGPYHPGHCILQVLAPDLYVYHFYRPYT